MNKMFLPYWKKNVNQLTAYSKWIERNVSQGRWWSQRRET